MEQQAKENPQGDLVGVIEADAIEGHTNVATLIGDGDGQGGHNCAIDFFAQALPECHGILATIGKDGIDTAIVFEGISGKDERQIAGLHIINHRQIELAVCFGQTASPRAIIGVGGVESNCGVAQEHHPLHPNALGDGQTMRYW